MRPIRTAALALALAATGAAAHDHPHRGSGGIGDRIAVAKGIIVIPEAVIEDSRCPADATCVWAGRLVVAVKVQFPDGTIPVRLTLGSPQAVGADRLLLESATPQLNAAAPVTSGYSFTFAYLPAH